MRRAYLITGAMAGLLVLAGCSEQQDNGEPAEVGDAAAEDIEAADVAPDGIAAADPQPEERPGGLTVQGEGRVMGEPDVLRVTVGVEHFDDDAGAAISAMNNDIDAVISALLDEGIADEDLQTAQLRIHPELDRDGQNGAPEPVGYRALNTVEASVRDIESVGSVLDAAIDAGGDATRVQGVRFALEDNEELLERARQEAVVDARQRAEQYAQATDANLGALQEVTEVGADRPQPVTDGAAMDTADEAGPGGPSVQPGEEEVGVTVQVRWALTDGDG